MLVNSTTFERNISLVVGNLGKENKQKMTQGLISHFIHLYYPGRGGGEGGRAQGLLSVSLSQELFEAINIVNT